MYLEKEESMDIDNFDDNNNYIKDNNINGDRKGYKNDLRKNYENECFFQEAKEEKKK